MNINLNFSIDQINVLLRTLDAAPHGQVRQMIDYILAEASRQQQVFHAAQESRAEVE